MFSVYTMNQKIIIRDYYSRILLLNNCIITCVHLCVITSNQVTPMRILSRLRKLLEVLKLKLHTEEMYEGNIGFQD